MDGLNRLMDKCVNEEIDKYASKLKRGWRDGSMYAWMNEYKDRSMN